MENEEWLQGSVTGTRILETLVETTHSIDPTRSVTAAMNHGRNEGGYSDVLDVTGYNYGDKQLAYVKDHENHPKRVEFCTDSTSFVSTRGEYQNDWGKGFVSNLTKWQPDWGPFPGEDWADIVKYPFLGGTFVWTGFDYRGEPTPYQWPCVTSHFGFMDVCGFPKDGYYAIDQRGPMLLLFIFFLTGIGPVKKEVTSRYTATQIVKKLNCSSTAKV